MDERLPTRSRHSRTGRLAIHAGLLCVCAGYLLPFVWMFSTSLKSVEQTTETTPRFIPTPVQPENYVKLFHHPDFHAVLFARNTLWIALLSVTGSTISSAIAAYGFAKIPFRGRGLLFGIMLTTIMIPFPVTMVSLFRVFRWMDVQSSHWLSPPLADALQMLGTYKPLWLPTWFGSAFNIFLLRQFVGSPGTELEFAL